MKAHRSITKIQNNNKRRGKNAAGVERVEKCNIFNKRKRYRRKKNGRT